MEKLIEALKLNLALDMPYRDGLAILKAAGWDESERFEMGAKKFVAQKTKEALESVNAA